MPLFLSEEEFLRCSHDVTLVAEKADAFIQDLYLQLETVKAESDAATITAEQTCSLIEQKYVSLSMEFSSLQSQHSELNASLEQRASELEKLQSERQQLLLQSIDKNGEIERLAREASEFHKSKRQLMEMLERKDLEISEKNATIKGYLDKIVNLAESVASKEARLGDVESELTRMHATSARYLQEKELVERHNTWLNEELTSKVDSLIQLRKANGELEADLSSKLADVERKYKESSDSLTFHKDRVRELETKLASLEEELLSTKDAAASAEDRFSAEIATVSKLVELYKESAEEWSKKAGELEGVIKALETHLNQVEKEYKDKLEIEESSRKEAERECTELKETLRTCKAELETLKKENELKDQPLSSFITNSWGNSVDAGEMVEYDRAVVPRVPAGVSGTALAASLLRDGWSLAEMYRKYQEAVDALRHEQLGRKQTQAILERVLYEIEEKAGTIMEEREEHERLVEAYSSLNEKLQHSVSDHSALETTIQGLKASLKKQERDYVVAQKEIADLQKQVAVLLKECRDVQLRCGSSVSGIDDVNGPAASFHAESNVENLISERLLTFKDINGLVERNVQLQSLVHSLTRQIEENEAESKEKYEKELNKLTAETASKVNAVLQRSEEQVNMIESLHNSVAMYKKLYEEEHKLRSYHQPREAATEQGSREIVLFRGSVHETSTKSQENVPERMKNLEEDLAKSRSDVITLRAERDKLALEAQFKQEKLARFMKDFEQQRQEHYGVLARNVEFSQLIVGYQRKLREFSESVNASEELSRKLNMEVSVLKHEKEILQNSEKRASDEVRSLSERLHRLQASLDTIQSTEIAREEARSIEKRMQEEYTKKIEREWAEAKKELQDERDNVRKLKMENETTMKNALRQVEELSKDLASAMQSVAAAESRAALAEARRSDLEKIIESGRTKDSDGAEGDLSSSSSEKVLANFRDEIEKLRGEAQANKDHMLQYRSIAQVNEAALKQMEVAKLEADQVRSSLEAEAHSLRERINELENQCKLKTEEVRNANAGKEDALAGVSSEIVSLKNDCSLKMSQIVVMESRLSALKQDLEEEHQRWQAAQRNYERQVILQSETIQELTKTSQALAASQEETSELRGVVDTLKAENNELKSKWETEKLTAEVYKNEVDKKYNEVDELNKILHSRLEAIHIKLADKELGKSSGSSSQTFADDDGLQNVVNYLRRSKEIAETEISLLRQEKLRLQSQLESASKSAEAAQALLRSDREKSRASLFTEEEFKSLQLQLRELNLLRESNVQLREENRHNFEECQKLREAFQNVRTETENMEKLLKDTETELENQRKENEHLKMEKLHCEKRIDELVEKCNSVDLDDYNRLKESLQQIQANLREKAAELEEVKKLLLEKQEAVSVLERDLSRCRTELNERETRINGILESEASLKSEVEKLKKINVLSRRKVESLSKEKDDLNKEMQVLSKQLEDAKQVKNNILDSANEQALREKEKEKDTRIQILERTLERHREELKKQKEDHQKEREKMRQKSIEMKKTSIESFKKTSLDSFKKVDHEKKQLSDELTKHQLALKLLQGEVEKLKSPGGSQPDSTPVVQHIATTLLDDLASAYFQAVEHFEHVASSTEINSAAPLDTSLRDNTAPVEAMVSQPVTSSTPTSPARTANVQSTITSDERRRRLAIPKANVKTGRRLVRPSIAKPKESQGDVEMSETDESKADEFNAGSSSLDAETHGNPTVLTKSPVRKRSSDEILTLEETSSDLPDPVLKKPKSSETLHDSGELKPPEVVGTDETLDEVGNLEEPSREEPDDAEREESEAPGEHVDEQAPDERNQAEPLTEMGEITDEAKSDKCSEAVILSDDQLRDQTEEDIQRIVTDFEEREEGELDVDLGDNDGDGNVSDMVTGQEVGEYQADESVEPQRSPSVEPSFGDALEAGEIVPSDTQDEEKNETDMTENVGSSDKPSHGVRSSVASTNTVAGSSSATVVEASGSSTSAEIASPVQADTGVRPPSPVNTTINLQERARQRALTRQAELMRSLPNRGRGRGVRGRVARGGRTPRGQSPG